MWSLCEVDEQKSQACLVDSLGVLSTDKGNVLEEEVSVLFEDLIRKTI